MKKLVLLCCMSCRLLRLCICLTVACIVIVTVLQNRLPPHTPTYVTCSHPWVSRDRSSSRKTDFHSASEHSRLKDGQAGNPPSVLVKAKRSHPVDRNRFVHSGTGAVREWSLNAKWAATAVNTTLSMSSTISRLPVPVVVVEEHHETIPYWFRAAESGRLQRKGNVLVSLKSPFSHGWIFAGCIFEF